MVKSGDTLRSVARFFRTTAPTIRGLNRGVRASKPLAVGQASGPVHVLGWT